MRQRHRIIAALFMMLLVGNGEAAANVPTASADLGEAAWFSQLAARLKGGKAGGEGVQGILDRHERATGRSYPRAPLLDFVHLVCLKEGDRACLRQLLELSDSKLKRAWWHLSLAELAGDWRQKQFELQQALALAPQDLKVQFLSQHFSLQMAEKLLEAYQSELYQASILRKLGLEDLKSKQFNLLDGVAQVLFNTWNVATIWVTDRDEVLLKEWSRQMDAVSSLLWGLRMQKMRIEKELQPLHLLRARVLADERMLTAEKRFLATPYYRMIRWRGLFGRFARAADVRLPAMRDFGFVPREDLIQLHWTESLLKELNLANVLMIAKGPALVEALFKCPWGVAAASALRLQRWNRQISTWPKPVAGFVIWFAMETADGCVLRWAYMAKVLVDQSHSPDKVEARVSGSLR